MSWNKASAVDKSYFVLETRFPFVGKHFSYRLLPCFLMNKQSVVE